jgi:uncharacterized phage protein (TIGR01671 family)
MREIKFRMWYIQLDEVGEEFGVMDYMVEDSPLGDYVPLSHLQKAAKAGHLMQYTGLKDMNGVEIYEGDLVNIGGQYPVEVLFLDGGYCYIIDKYIYTINDLDGGTVVGNIHENKEMLGE